MEKVDKGTIVRMAVLLLALVNQILGIAGKSPLPIESKLLEQIVSALFTLIMSLITWFKYNCVIKKDKKQKEKYHEKRLPYNRRKKKMQPILIIDPGHGGKDPGGGSNQYWTEKDMNLLISLYQYERYKQLGIPVAITRDSDVTLDPDERTRIIRESGAEFCHSNHINSGGGDGAEVIHSIYGGRKMAGEIAEELEKAGQNIRRVFTRTLPQYPKRDYYFMNRETGNVVTNIIEYGFADSIRDDVNQLNLNYIKYAEAVVKAFCQFSGYGYMKRELQIPVEEERKQEKRYLYLPSSASSWRVYPMDRSPVKGNEKGFLRPAKFGGLKYEILGNPQEDVYMIQTRDFGRVQIFAHTNTGASFSTG